MSNKSLIIILGVGGVLLYLMTPKDKDPAAIGGVYAKPRRIL